METGNKKNESIASPPLKRLVRCAMWIIAFTLLLFPFVDWFSNPELTEMQIFIKHWVKYLIATITLIILTWKTT